MNTSRFFYSAPPKKKRQLRKKKILLFCPLWLRRCPPPAVAESIQSHRLLEPPRPFHATHSPKRWTRSPRPWRQLGGGLLSCGPFSLGFTTLNGKCCYASFPTKKWGAILKKDYFGVEREVKLHLWILEGFVEKKLPRKSRKHVATLNFLICEPN